MSRQSMYGDAPEDEFKELNSADRARSLQIYLGEIRRLTPKALAEIEKPCECEK